VLLRVRLIAVRFRIIFNPSAIYLLAHIKEENAHLQLRPKQVTATRPSIKVFKMFAWEGFQQRINRRCHSAEVEHHDYAAAGRKANKRRQPRVRQRRLSLLRWGQCLAQARHQKTTKSKRAVNPNRGAVRGQAAATIICMQTIRNRLKANACPQVTKSQDRRAAPCSERSCGMPRGPASCPHLARNHFYWQRRGLLRWQGWSLVFQNPAS